MPTDSDVLAALQGEAFEAFRSAVAHDVAEAIVAGGEALKGLGPAYEGWAMEAVKISIAESARAQTWLSPEGYARICAGLVRELATEGGA